MAKFSLIIGMVLLAAVLWLFGVIFVTHLTEGLGGSTTDFLVNVYTVLLIVGMGFWTYKSIKRMTSE